MFLERLREMMQNITQIVGAVAKNWTEHLLNRSLGNYGYASLLGSLVIIVTELSGSQHWNADIITKFMRFPTMQLREDKATSASHTLSNAIWNLLKQFFWTVGSKHITSMMYPNYHEVNYSTILKNLTVANEPFPWMPQSISFVANILMQLSRCFVPFLLLLPFSQSYPDTLFSHQFKIKLYCACRPAAMQRRWKKQRYNSRY
jgi:hypothetical protein